MKTVYLVRHGESTSNAGGIILGGAKTPLTEEGRQQAAFVGERLTRLPVDVIIASTYLRTRQTAEIIAEKIGMPLEFSELFVEWNQGTNRIGKNANDQHIVEQTKDFIEHFAEQERRITDEENFTDLNTRADKALSYLIGRSENHIVVVGHGWFTPVLLGRAVMGDDFTGRDCSHFMKAFRVKNTGLSVLSYGNPKFSWYPWNVVTWNDHAHLG